MRYNICREQIYLQWGSIMIGSKIKELRQKNDLTQEKLADFLCVSYQAVSKWECGISNPDLSMIAPLARLFNVTADELLGLNKPEPDKHRSELEAAHQVTWKNGDLVARHIAAEALVKAYPGDMKYLDWLAWTTAMRSFENKDDETYIAEQEKAIKMFAVVIENSTDGEVKNSAIQGIVQYLCFRGRKDDAHKYADLYPESNTITKDEILLSCLSGDEHKKHWQTIVQDRLEKLWFALDSNYHTMHSQQLVEALIELFVPDENYLRYHVPMYYANKRQAGFLLSEARYDEAITKIKNALHHAVAFDEIFEKKQKYQNTAPLFDLLEYDTDNTAQSGTATLTEEINEWLKHEQFNVVRERVDFKEFAVHT